MRKRKSFRRMAQLALAFILVISNVAVAALAASTAADVKNSVVVVQNQDGVTFGSGFVIGEVGQPVQYVVTNDHIVEGSLGNTNAMVYFSIASDKKMLATVYLSDPERDIAILRLPEPTTEREAFALCPMDAVDAGSDFAVLGYPDPQSANWSSYSTDDITVTKTGIIRGERINNYQTYQIDADINYGNTGGPMASAGGEIVGINAVGLGDGRHVIAVDELLTLLENDRNRIPVTVHGQAGGIPTLLVLAIVIAAVIIALIVWLVLRNRKETHSAVSDYAAPESAGGPGNATTPVYPQKGPGARVVIVGGILNGKKYTVNGAIKIGRDGSQCGIVYPANTKGVSAVHCEISFNGSVCYIKDLKSSFGTFLMDGTKLAPHIPQILKSGDKFYLASPDNLFEIHF